MVTGSLSAYRAVCLSTYPSTARSLLEVAGGPLFLDEASLSNTRVRSDPCPQTEALRTVDLEPFPIVVSKASSPWLRAWQRGRACARKGVRVLLQEGSQAHSHPETTAATATTSTTCSTTSTTKTAFYKNTTTIITPTLWNPVCMLSRNTG